MISEKDRKSLEGFGRFSISMMLAGILTFIGTIVLFLYNCKTHQFELSIMYVYAGLSVGFAFSFAGLIMVIASKKVIRILKGKE